MFSSILAMASDGREVGLTDVGVVREKVGDFQAVHPA